jgi:hypothetical protein
MVSLFSFHVAVYKEMEVIDLVLHVGNFFTFDLEI